MELENYKLQGYVDAEVRGLHYYKDASHPTPLPFQVITLLREPSNPIDRNTILVTDPQLDSAILGYVAREVAAELAPLLDSGTALARAVVSVPPPNKGSPNVIPCNVLLFSTAEFTSEVQCQLPLLDVSSKQFAFYPVVRSGLSLKDFDQMVYKCQPCIRTLEDAVKYYSPPIDPATRNKKFLEIGLMMGVNYHLDEPDLVQLPSTSTNAPPGHLDGLV